MRGKGCSVKSCKRPIRTKGKCASHYAKSWNKANKERYNENGIRSYRKNPATKKRREQARAAKRYGITIQEYDAMFKAQKGLCAICGKPERTRNRVDASIRSLAIDHDHKTGKVRALLCVQCNGGLGQFDDNLKLLQAAILYLSPKATRTFASGATRDNMEGKLQYEGFLSPLVLERYAQYMDKHRLQSDGSLRAPDNWTKGIPSEAYKDSLIRHVFDAWIAWRSGNIDQEILCAIMFNVMGLLYEELKKLASNRP